MSIRVLMASNFKTAIAVLPVLALHFVALTAFVYMGDKFITEVMGGNVFKNGRSSFPSGTLWTCLLLGCAGVAAGASGAFYAYLADSAASRGIFTGLLFYTFLAANICVIVIGGIMAFILGFFGLLSLSVVMLSVPVIVFAYVFLLFLPVISGS